MKIEYKKIKNLMDTTTDNVPRFITKKWIKVRDQSGNADNRYRPSKQIRFKTSTLQSGLCDYSDAYIVVKGTITVQTENNRAIDGYNRILLLENNAPFINCISKINNVLVGNAEDLGIVMPTYNLIEYSKNHSKNIRYLMKVLQRYKDITTDHLTNSESFKYKTIITGKTANDGNTKEVDFSIPLKHLSTFWRTLDISLINCEVPLTLTWSKNCIINDETTIDADPNANPPVIEIRGPTNAKLKITDTKLYVPVVTLSTQDDNKLLE